MTCTVSCSTHAQTRFHLDRGDIPWLRANLPLIRRLGRGLWAKQCKCNLLESVERAVRNVH